MQYIFSEEEHQHYVDNMMELLHFRSDNEDLIKENEELSKNNINLQEEIKRLNQWLELTREQRDVCKEIAERNKVKIEEVEKKCENIIDDNHVMEPF